MTNDAAAKDHGIDSGSLFKKIDALHTKGLIAEFARRTAHTVRTRFINRKARVSLQATQVRIFDGRTRSPPTVSRVSAPRIAHMSKMPRRC
jgi:hypothetical protein